MAAIIKRVPHNSKAARIVSFDSDGRFIWRGPVRESMEQSFSDMAMVPDNAQFSFPVSIAEHSRFFEDECFEEIVSN
jgi:hypothetical protein